MNGTRTGVAAVLVVALASLAQSADAQDSAYLRLQGSNGDIEGESTAPDGTENLIECIKIRVDTSAGSPTQGGSGSSPAGQVTCRMRANRSAPKLYVALGIQDQLQAEALVFSSAAQGPGGSAGLLYTFVAELIVSSIRFVNATSGEGPLMEVAFDYRSLTVTHEPSGETTGN